MKNSLFAFAAAGCISSLAITNGAYSQPKADIASLGFPKHAYSPVTVVPESSNTFDMSAITSKAVKDSKKSYKGSKKSYKDLKSSYTAGKNFKRYFQTGNDEKWYKSSDGFMVIFTYDGVTNRISYNENGRWTSSFKEYSEEHATPAVTDMFKSRYPGYKIKHVYEIETCASKNIPTYVVYSEDADNIKLVRICDEQMDIYQEFEKQK